MKTEQNKLLQILKERLDCEVAKPEFESRKNGVIEFGTQTWNEVIGVIDEFAGKFFDNNKQNCLALKTRADFRNILANKYNECLYNEVFRNQLFKYGVDYRSKNVNSIHTALTNELILATYNNL